MRDKELELMNCIKHNIIVEDIFGYKEEITLYNFLKQFKHNFKKDYYALFNKIKRRCFVYCQHCEEFKATKIHHIDHNHRNNKLNNLIFLCKKCHITVHSHPIQLRYYRIKHHNTLTKIENIMDNTDFKNVRLLALYQYLRS